MNRDAAARQVAAQSEIAAGLIGGLAGEPFIPDAAAAIIDSLRDGGALYTCGNGGSAADAQHIAAELSGKFYLVRPALAATALTVNTSALTAIGNDFDYDEVFSRQLQGVGRRGDVLLAITTSGGSPNVRQAIAVARDLEMTVIGMTGARGADFAALCDHCLVVPSEDTPRIQEAHIFSGHLVCQLVEADLFGDGA